MPNSEDQTDLLDIHMPMVMIGLTLRSPSFIKSHRLTTNQHAYANVNVNKSTVAYLTRQGWNLNTNGLPIVTSKNLPQTEIQTRGQNAFIHSMHHPTPPLRYFWKRTDMYISWSSKKSPVFKYKRDAKEMCVGYKVNDKSV